METLQWIQEWYKSNCDGYWEHMYGVKIDTLDNPGWIVQIDLLDTPLEQKEFDRVQYDKNDEEWFICSKENGIFKASGGPSKLEEILQIFKIWVESNSN